MVRNVEEVILFIHKVKVQCFSFLVIYLFKKFSEFSTKGFSDWKKPKSINKHENSLSHKTCVVKMKNRSTNLNRVDIKHYNIKWKQKKCIGKMF